MRKIEKTCAVLLCAAMTAGLLVGCGASSSSEVASSEAASVAESEAASEAEVAEEPAESEAASEEAAEAAAIQVLFTVTYEDESSEEFTLDAVDGELLSDALLNAELISEDEAAAGFVTVVNGVEANWDADQAWWCLTDGDGEMTAVGIGEIELHDGDSYAFTYTAG